MRSSSSRLRVRPLTTCSLWAGRERGSSAARPDGARIFHGSRRPSCAAAARSFTPPISPSVCVTSSSSQRAARGSTSRPDMPPISSRNTTPPNATRRPGPRGRWAPSSRWRQASHFPSRASGRGRYRAHTGSSSNRRRTRSRSFTVPGAAPVLRGEPSGRPSESRDERASTNSETCSRRCREHREQSGKWGGRMKTGSKVNWKGCGTALVTPFDEQGRIDFGALERFVNWQIERGIDFLVPCGTTGESATLSGDERKAVTAAVVKVTNSRVPVIAGAGGNHTAKAVFWARDAAEVGADGILSVSPMYNKPRPEGLGPGRRDDPALDRDPADRRLERSLGQLRQDRAADDHAARRLPGLLGRRLDRARAHRARRAGVDLRRLQRDPPRHERPGPRGAPRQLGGGAQAPAQVPRAHGDELLGVEPRAGQVRALAHEKNRRDSAAAACPGARGHAKENRESSLEIQAPSQERQPVRPELARRIEAIVSEPDKYPLDEARAAFEDLKAG